MHKILARGFGFDVRTERREDGKTSDVQVQRPGKSWTTIGVVAGSKEDGWMWAHTGTTKSGASATRTDALRALMETEKTKPTTAPSKRGKGRPKGYSPVTGKITPEGAEEELQSFSLKLTRATVEAIKQAGGRPFVRDVIEKELGRLAKPPRTRAKAG